MTFKPAHKQDNPDLKPGQTVYGFDRYPYLKSGSVAEPPAKQRLTFDEWYVTIRPKNKGMPWDDWFVCMQEAWRAGQENAK